MIRRQPSAPGAPRRGPVRRRPGLAAALLCAAGCMAVAPTVAARADSQPVKDLVLVDATTTKKVWLKQAVLSTFEVHLSDKYFPKLERPFGKLVLTTLSVQPVLGYAPREIATTAAKPELRGKTYYVVPLQPKPCTLDKIHDPPIEGVKSLEPAQKLDAEFAFYQYAAAACADAGDKPLRVALDMFRAKTLKEACEQGGRFTCGDALELYDRLRTQLAAGTITAEDFKQGRVSPRLIRVRVAQILQRALEEGMRFYVQNRNATDRRAMLDYLDRIAGHPLVAASTRSQAERGKKTVMDDWCRVDPKGCKEQRGSVPARRGTPG